MRGPLSTFRVRGSALHLVTLLLAFASFQLAAASTDENVSLETVRLTIEDLERGLVLRDGWRFRAGDDPVWADPSYDDRSWSRVDSRGGRFGPDWQGIGWLRRRLVVDPAFPETVVGLRVRQAGASELYLDGHLVAKLGRVSADPRREQAWDPKFPVAVALEPGGEHLLAVRFSLAHEHEIAGGLRGLEVTLGRLDRMLKKATRGLRNLVPFMAAAAGLAGALALVHGLLFVFDRRAAEHGFMAIFSGFLALDVFADMMTNLTADYDVQLLWFRLGVVFLIALLLSGIHLELVLFGRRRGWSFWGLVVFGLGMLVWVLSIPGFRNITGFVIFMMLALAEMLRLAVMELVRGRPGSAVVAAGIAVFALSFSDFFAGYFGLWHIPAGVVILIGWGAAAVSLSLYIARRAARINWELRLRLDEVAALTQRTVEQERQAGRELAERRVLEADNARKTLEIKEARELQMAMLPDDRPNLADVDVAFRILTATEVGGDYYDYVTDGPERCTIVVGDATGHGMHAGMVVAVAKSLFTTLAAAAEPAQVLREVSRSLTGLRRRGAAMAMALIRIEGTRLSIAGAAMPPLLVWRRAGEEIEEVSLSAPPLGSPLGGEFVCKTVDLEAGDAVLVFTDGLAEVLDNKDEAWGYERVEETFARAAPRGPEASLDELFAAVEAFANGREFSDDITLVAIQA